MANYGAYAERSSSRSTGVPGESSATRGTPVPDTQSSHVPMEMSLEDFVSQPGRNRLPELHPLEPTNTTWFHLSHNGITKSILRMMHGILKTPYPKFSEMPSDEQEIWLKQFAQDFTWHREFTHDVRKAFKKIAAKHYSYTLYEWKRRWIRGKMPKGANQEVFNGLIRYWGKPETISLSKKNSKNRKSNRGGLGIATHNAGATSASSRQRQLTVRDGVVPDNLTLMEDMHTNKKTKQVQDGRAKMVLENVKRRKETELLSQSVDGSVTSPELGREKMNEILYEETHKSKGRIFGLGNLSQISSSSRSSGFSYPSHVDFEKAMEEKNERIATLEKEMEEQRAALEEQKAENMRRDAEYKKRDEEMATFMNEMRAKLP